MVIFKNLIIILPTKISHSLALHNVLWNISPLRLRQFYRGVKCVYITLDGIHQQCKLPSPKPAQRLKQTFLRNLVSQCSCPISTHVFLALIFT